MLTRFPDEPTFAGPNAPMRVEADITSLEVSGGEVPENLRGTYYRVVADPQWPPMAAGDIPFNWDGMVMSFRFTDGHVDYKSRYVRTPRFVAERAARRALFGAYRNPFTDDPSVSGITRGLANTNVYWHAGRLFASKEDSPPSLIDPDTLETLGEHTFEGTLSSSTCTAHPKVDPRTGEIVFFGFAARGETTPDIAYYEADRDGNIVHEAWIQAPYSSMVHDFAVTQNYVVFPIIPLTSDLPRLKEGGSHYAWDPNLDVFLGVLPRKGAASTVRWYRGGNRFASHIMNSFDDGRHIYIDTPVSPSSYFPFFPDLTGRPFTPTRALGRLSRWTIDTMSAPENGFAERRLCQLPGEFPRIDDRQETLPYRFGYQGLLDVPGEQRPGTGFRWIGATDVSTGHTRTHYVGPEANAAEPIFVPAHERAGTGQGYLFVIVCRHAENRSDLLILDATAVDGPPVATIKLPIRLPYGLHGNWVPAFELATRRV